MIARLQASNANRWAEALQIGVNVNEKYKAKYASMSANIEAIEKGDERAIFELIFRMAGEIENPPNNACNRPASAVGTQSESDESAGG